MQRSCCESPLTLRGAPQPRLSQRATKRLRSKRFVDCGGIAGLHRSAGDHGFIEAKQKKKSRPVSRVLSWTVIPLGLTSPSGSSNLPGSSAGHANAPLFGLAPSGVCHATRRCPRARCALTAPFHPYPHPLRRLRRSVLCCTFRRLTPPRRYLAPCPVEPGLSSQRLRTSRLSGRLHAHSSAFRNRCRRNICGGDTGAVQTS